jgi:mRNA interferase MazF
MRLHHDAPKAVSSWCCWTVLRGEVWHVDLEPARGSEANKQRPAVIVSNDRANSTAMRLGHGVVTVVPISSNTVKIYPFQVLLSSATNGLAVDSKAQAEQIRSVAAQRLLRRLGRVSPDELTAIDDALRLHLGL